MLSIWRAPGLALGLTVNDSDTLRLQDTTVLKLRLLTVVGDTDSLTLCVELRSTVTLKVTEGTDTCDVACAGRCTVPPTVASSPATLALADSELDKDAVATPAVVVTVPVSDTVADSDSE